MCKTIVSIRSIPFPVSFKLTQMPSMQYNVDQFNRNEWAETMRNAGEGFCVCVKKDAQIKDKCHNNASG